VERVADEHDACDQGDLGASQAVGVAAAVPALVLGPDHGREVRERVHRRDDPLADLGVAAHVVALALGEPARLAQDGVADADLADVVQEGGGLDVVEVARRHAGLARHAQRQADDRLGVLAGVAVAGFQRGEQGVDLAGPQLALAGGAPHLVAVDLRAEQPAERAHERHVALADRAVGAVAEAAERPVDLAVRQCHGDADVRPDAGAARDRQVAHALVVDGVGDEAVELSGEHQRAVRALERHRLADRDAERRRVAARDAVVLQAVAHVGEVRLLHAERLASRLQRRLDERRRIRPHSRRRPDARPCCSRRGRPRTPPSV